MWLKYLLCLSIIIFLTACGGRDEADKPSKQQVHKEDAVNIDAGISFPCGGMTLERAAEILGVAVGEVRYSYSDMLGMCSFQAGLSKSLSYSLYTESDSGTAVVEMEKVAEGLRFLGSCEPVTDIGDEGIYCSGGRADRLLVRKGAVWLDVHGPAGFDAKKRVAQTVLN